MVAMLLSICAGLQAAPVVQPTRTFGYVIGDVLEQRIGLDAEGQRLELAETPPLQRVGPWLHRRSFQVVRDAHGREWLQLTYQVINSPTETRAISLPALQLRDIHGEALVVDAWPITVSPLTPLQTTADVTLPPMQPDRGPQLPPIRQSETRLRLAGAMLAATLAAWLAWWLWRQRSDARRRPFARAFHELRRLRQQPLDDCPAAWLVMHRALDEAAGRTVHRAGVGRLVGEQPWLTALRARIEAFYTASAARFFAEAEAPPAFALSEFSRELYLAEKRHGGSRRAPG